MPTIQKTHDQFRKTICFVCGKKPKIYPSRKPIDIFSDKQCDLVKRFVFWDYSLADPLDPTALCLTCNWTLLAFIMFFLTYFAKFFDYLLRTFFYRTLTSQEESFLHCWTTATLLEVLDSLGALKLCMSAGAVCVTLADWMANMP